MPIRNRLVCGAFATLLCTAGLCATPARATDWASVAGWDVYEVDARRCVVGRVFAEGPTTFGIILSLDGDTRVFATRAGWTMRAGAAVPASILLDGQALQAGSSVGIEQRQNRGFVAAVPATFLDRFATAAQLGLSTVPGQAPNALRLTGAAAGLAQGRRCLDNLREEARMRLAASPRPLPTGQPRAAAPRVAAASGRPGAASATTRAVASPASPRRPKSTWVTADDYPDAALRAEEEGSVTVKLAIDRTGEVAGCDIVRSSGSSALDGANCTTLDVGASPRISMATWSATRLTAGRDSRSTPSTTTRSAGPCRADRSGRRLSGLPSARKLSHERIAHRRATHRRSPERRALLPLISVTRPPNATPGTPVQPR